MSNTYIVGISSQDDEMAEVFTLDEWASLDRYDIPANRKWLQITTATEEHFATWKKNRREYETYNHRPYGPDTLNPVEEAEARDEYSQRCAKAEAAMQAAVIEEVML